MFSSRAPALAALAVGLGLYGGSTFAFMINDGYSGGADHGYGDRIGTAVFEVLGADVYRNGSVLTVEIFTNFAGHADEMMFAGYTNRDPSRINGTSMGIGYGDLFLSSAWNPAGAAPYLGDNHATGTVWQYGFSLDASRWSDAGGSGTLYALNGATNNANALLSEDFMSGATYRNGQEIAVDRASATVAAVGTGNWSVTSGTKLTYSFDISNTALMLSSTVALHWAMSCGNDTLEGAYEFPPPPPPPDTGVPEPATLALALLGLAGGVGARRLRGRA